MRCRRIILCEPNIDQMTSYVYNTNVTITNQYLIKLAIIIKAFTMIGL